jgi:hypothetical protein
MLSQTSYFLKMPGTTEKSGEQKSALKWVKRLGLAGFMFFLIKGLLWLLVPGLIAYFSFT